MFSADTQWRRWLGLGTLLVCLVVLLSCTYPVQEANRRLNDLYLRWRGPLPPSRDVALVLIDDASLGRFGRWPWRRALLARLVRAVSAHHPAAIGLDVIFSEPEDPSDDNELRRSLAAAGNVVLADKIAGINEGRLWVEPLSRFSHAAAAVGHVQAAVGPDGICRGVPVCELSTDGPRWAFAIEVARIFDSVKLMSAGELLADEPGASCQPTSARPRLLEINFRGQVLAASEPAPFVAVSAADLLSGRHIDGLAGKAVLIGFGSTELTDQLPTPVSDQLPMPGVEIHANVVDSVLSHSILRSASVSWDSLVILATSALALWVVLHRPAWTGAIVCVALVALAYAAGYFVFLHAHLLLPMGSVMLAGLSAIPLGQIQNLLAVDRGITGALRRLYTSLLLSAGNTGRPGRWLGHASAQPGVQGKLRRLVSLQDELAELYEFEDVLLHAIPNAVGVFSPSGEILFYNEQWLRFCQLSRRDPRSKLREFTSLDSDSYRRSLCEQLCTLHEPIEFETRFDDTLWQVCVVPMPETRGIRGGGAFVVATDVTTRLERDRARAEAIAFVTHELRTPLVSIQGFAELIERNPASAATGDAASTIFRESRRLLAMIDTYLDVLRLEAGTGFQLRQLNVEDVVKQVRRVIEPLAQAAEIEVNVEFSAEPVPLWGDETLIAGALLNLLSNALKYSPASSSVRLQVSANDAEMRFEITNAARSGDSTNFERLFQPFERGVAHEDSTRGWGLGLAFVKRIAEAHGGRVLASSREGLITFSMALPLQPTLISEVVT